MITHRKTRTGCVQCKQRRIKCDETKPKCEKCRRTNRECSFQTVGSGSTNAPTGGVSSDVFTMKEMELLHNFIMNTGMTIVNSAALQRVWQTGVIELALKHKFLMHTILALSAMHLAYLRPAESASLMVLAANHQDLGLAGFRSELAQFNENNCHALFASSILVIFYIPASSCTRHDHNASSSNSFNEILFSHVIDWTRLIRGCHHIITRGRHWLERGPTANLLPREAWYKSIEPMDERSRNEDRYLASLERLWAPDTPTHTSRYDDGEIEAYKTALIELRNSFARMHIATSTSQDCCWCSDTAEDPVEMDNRVPRIVAAVLWGMLIPDRFFELLEQRKPVALVLLAHQAITTKRVSTEWWNHGPPLRIVATVTAALPPEYHAWIEWPQREVGYSSNSDTFKPSQVAR